MSYARTSGRRNTVLGAVVVMLISLMPAASANNWFGNTGRAGGAGTCVGRNMTDSSNVVFNYVDVSRGQRRAANWVRANRIDPTVLSTTYASPRTRQTDVLVADKRYRTFCEVEQNIEWYPDGGTVGFTTCDYRRPGGRCDQAVTRFSRDFNEDFPRRARRSLTCHEFGHAIGLAHRRGPGCMPPSIPSGTNYSDHDRAHFRQFFG